MSGFCSLLFRFLSVRCEAVVISQGSVFIFCPLSPSRPDPCLASICLSSSFSCMVCSSTPCVLVLVLSLSLSLRRWGTPNLFGLGFPLCFFNLDTLSALDPYVFLFTYTQALPRTCFFFSFRRRRSFPVRCLLVLVLSVSVFLVDVFFFCLWSLFSSVRCIARQT